MTFYGTPATGAGWIVPKKYVEKVGDDGLQEGARSAPGPYKFVSLQARRRAGAGGLRAATGARRRASSGWSSRSIPTRRRGWPRSSAARSTSPTRSAGALAEELQRTPGLTLKPTVHPGARTGSYFARPVGPEVAVARPARAPGRQPRHRPAGDQPGRDARLLARSPAASSRSTFEFYWQPPALRRSIRRRPSSCSPRPATRTASTRRLLLRLVLANLGRGRRSTTSTRRDPVRSCAARAAAFFARRPRQEAEEHHPDRQRRLRQRGHRLEAFVGRGAPTPTAAIPTSTGSSASSGELDPKRREAMLHRIQQLIHEKAMYRRSGSWPSSTDAAARGGVGLDLIAGHPYSAPYEDVN